MGFRKITFTLSLFCCLSNAFSQALVRSNQIPVLVNNDTLRAAWAGGMQAPQFSSIDLDNDGRRDLVVFDRLDNRILPYRRISTGAQGLRYSPEFTDAFPSEIYNWMIAADYDRDGFMDIFCGTSQGSNVQVYRNTSQLGAPLSFQRIHSKLYSTYPNLLPLYSAATDLPAIFDIDGDLDLDILTFNVGGGFVEWHRNLSVENFASFDSLVFDVQSRCFGHFQESPAGCTATIGLVPCGTGERNSHEEKHALHVGSTLLATDLDGDTLADLIVGDVGCREVYALHNAGTREIAHFDFIETGFPSQSMPVDILGFPGLFQVDLDEDGLLDLLSAPNTASQSEDVSGIQWHRNTGSNEVPEYVHQGYGIFQDEMIELGTGAHPVFFDYNSDGLLDLILGCAGKFDSSGSLIPRMMLFEHTGTSNEPAFTLVDDDYLGFFQSQILPQTNGLSPALGDLDGDGDEDMLIGHQDGGLYYFRNTASTGGTATFNFVSTSYAGIDVGLNSAPCIYDYDGDARLDLLIGNAKGRISYYRNTGTSTTPVFTLITDSLGLIKINDASGLSFTNGFTKPAVADVDGDQTKELLVGTITGEVQVYEMNPASPTSSFVRLPNLGNLDFGSYSAPASADLGPYNLTYVVGNLRGGLELVQDQRLVFAEAPIVPNIQISAFPNPVQDEITIAISPTTKPTKLRVVNSLGVVILNQDFLFAEVMISTQNWPAGIYLLQVESKLASGTYRILKID